MSKPEVKVPEYDQDEVVTLADITYKITGIVQVAELGPPRMKKRADGMFLVIRLSLKNIGRGPVGNTSIPLFELEDSLGNKYASNQTVLFPYDLQFKMSTEPLNPNITMTGGLAFDVPERNEYKLKVFSRSAALHALAELDEQGVYCFYFRLNGVRTSNSADSLSH